MSIPENNCETLVFRIVKTSTLKIFLISSINSEQIPKLVERSSTFFRLLYSELRQVPQRGQGAEIETFSMHCFAGIFIFSVQKPICVYKSFSRVLEDRFCKFSVLFKVYVQSKVFIGIYFILEWDVLYSYLVYLFKMRLLSQSHL